MNKDNRIQARIEPELKRAAESVFAQLGISSGEAIRMFYSQVRMRGGIPFDVTVPNQETLDAIEEAEHPETLDKYTSFGSLRNELGV